MGSGSWACLRSRKGSKTHASYRKDRDWGPEDPLLENGNIWYFRIFVVCVGKLAHLRSGVARAALPTLLFLGLLVLSSLCPIFSSLRSASMPYPPQVILFFVLNCRFRVITRTHRFIDPLALPTGYAACACGLYHDVPRTPTTFCGMCIQ